MISLQKEVKILVVGSTGVGKTSLIKQFCRGTYTDEYSKTVGVDFMEKVQHVDYLKQDVKIMLWDTVGEDAFNSITRNYYKGAAAAVLVFSTTDRESFEALAKWRDMVVEECGEVAMAIVQNKVDLIERAAMSSEEAEAMARRLNLRFYRTCVKEDLNVASVLTYLVELHAKKARLKIDNIEKVMDSGGRTPRASLSMSESLKVQLQQQKQASRRTSKCLLM
ncbi:Ras-related protein Rab-35 [Coccomyxa sp. Obi]|nr:Ras-related protein Rab-35 [Coccomyxa sp. Obi]